MYRLFMECFPGLNVSEDYFNRRLLQDEPDVFKTFKDGVLAGFAIVRGASLRMLCVAPGARGCSIGSQLLLTCEDFIKSQGHDKVILGIGESYLFQGVPVLGDAPEFFKKRGYVSDWVSADLTMPLGSYSPEFAPELPEGCTFRLLKPAQLAPIPEIVGKVERDWVRFFTDDKAPVFAAFLNDRIAGFLLLGDDAEVAYIPAQMRAGSIACVGVLPEYRRRGIGLRMVYEATMTLKALGCDTAYINYTHIAPWYEKLGYKTVMEFMMGGKKLD